MSALDAPPEAITPSVLRRARTLARTYSWAYGADFDDLLQEALIAAWQAHRRWRPGRGASHLTWATIRMRGRLMDITLAQPPPSIDIDDVDEAAFAYTDPALAQVEDRATLVQLLKHLPRRQVEMLVERYVLQWPLIRVGQQNSMSESGALQAIRAALRAAQQRPARMLTAPRPKKALPPTPAAPVIPHCQWCGVQMPGAPRYKRYCGGAHRIAAFRARHRGQPLAS